MRLSIIIPCLNAAGTLHAQLRAIARQEWRDEWEVIVVDNGSTDGSRSIIASFRNYLPHLRLADASDRKGAGHARNVGARLATGDALLFCDADDEVSTGWLSAMGEALTTHPFVACRLDMERLNPGLPAPFYEHPQRRGLNHLEFARYLPHAGGGTLGVWRQVHDTIGGFDPTFSAHEDTDYCVRAHFGGWALQFVPDALVHVRRRHTWWGNYRQARLRGSAYARLYALYRPDPAPGWHLHGHGLWRWGAFLQEWKNLARVLLRAHSWGDLALLSWGVGWLLGLLAGSLRHRISPPIGFDRPI